MAWLRRYDGPVANVVARQGAAVFGGTTRRSNKGLKLTKPSLMELRSLTLCSTDGEESRRARLGAMAPYLTRAQYLVAAAKPKRRFRSISLEGFTLTLREPIPGPSYW